MEWGSTTLAFYGLGAAAVATSLVTLRRRLELSKAKHGTLSGHANRARRLAWGIASSSRSAHSIENVRTAASR